jgi:predicted MFS family arabinose efflux permease
MEANAAEICAFPEGTLESGEEVSAAALADEVIHASRARLREWAIIFVLAAVQFTHSMDFIIMMPLGPQCREELGISPQQFARMVAAYGYSAALGSLLAAWFIDRFDRKTAMLILYAGFSAGTLLCAVAPGYWSLVLARAVAGAFGGVVAALILVIIGDAFPEERRGQATGMVMTAFSVASIAGLPAGILIGNRLGVRFPFGILGALSCAIWLLAYLVLPSLRGHFGKARDSVAQTWTVLTQPAHLRAYAFMVMLVMGTFTIAPHFSDYLVHNVGLDKDALGYIYFCGGLLTFVTLPIIGRCADRFGKRPIFRIMAVCTLLTVLAITNLPAMALVPLLGVTTLYWIFTSGRWVPAMAMITSSALPHYRGSFMSINAAVQQLAIALAAEVAGMVVRVGTVDHLTGYATAGIIGACATGISLILAGWLTLAQPAPEMALAVDSLSGQ